ncbi:hypothetical protein M2451_004039 [Dysgonomonas sp. PFB1-18]|uniref:hypothetical protein n=1 Tax=unclassified Dysgonomonas TaxID=2630389 RepID=UPI00247494D9|nr:MULTISPECIES: hypothetical protein [unclassified Dysgonomonas]MDH6311158.1 hypothetical protein [Dysgonomonas sp. PF1-14]MDH6340012.1 hypothetical protein [Dysgonomonas sp. PF1-16]MDH6382692.1 hypothetical protein [Dysgonomonas sp. PFB1-18]MDH6398877.1 hypothetical protein [Dysgonomonas sp. PF1-23]
MTTMKEFDIIINDKGGDKLKDKLKDIKIEALSAKEVIEKIAEPSAASKIDSQLENLSKNANKIIASTAKVKEQYYATTNELFKSFSGYNKDMNERFVQLSAKSTKLSLTMEQMQGLNEKAYKTVTQTATAKLAASQAEIDALAKSAKSVEQVMAAYEKKKNLLEEQAEIEKARINNEYEEAKKAGGDIVAMEKLKAENIALIDNKLKEDLKQNAKSYEASAKSFNDKLYKSLTDGADVAAGTVSKKTKNMVNDAASNAAEALGIPQKALKEVAQAAIDAQDKNKKAAAEAKKAAETAGSATAAATATGAAAAKTAEATKIIIDVEETRKRINTNIEALKHYKLSLEQNGRAIIEQYDADLEAAKGNHEETKKLEAAKAAAIKYYGEEIIKTSQNITAQQKKEQDLGLVQWQQYAESFKKIATDVKDKVSMITTSATGMFKAMTDEIDQEIKDISQNLSETTREKEDYSNREKARIDKLKALGESVTEAEKDELETKLAIQKDYENKENDLKNQKTKKEVEKRKVEKIQRKIDLASQIVTATANVAEGVTKALKWGWPLGPVFAGMVGAMGAIQIGIMTKQLAKFADGGLLNGKRHSQGGMRIEGTNIEVEGGEYVVNRESTSKNLGLVRYINSQRRELKPTDLNSFFSKPWQSYESPFKEHFEAGGRLTPPIIDVPSQTMNNEELLKAIKSMNMKVAVTDIMRVQDEMTQVDGWSGI